MLRQGWDGRLRLSTRGWNQSLPPPPPGRKDWPPYRRHAAESGVATPNIRCCSLRMPSSVQRPRGPIVLSRPLRSDKVDYERELAVVIGRRCRNVPRAGPRLRAKLYLRRQRHQRPRPADVVGGGQWCRGKTFDTFVSCGARSRRQKEEPDVLASVIQRQLPIGSRVAFLQKDGGKINDTLRCRWEITGWELRLTTTAIS